MEMDTYRYHGHCPTLASPPQPRRGRASAPRAPSSARRHLLDGELATADELKAIDADVKKEVAAAVEAAKAASEPTEELHKDIYTHQSADFFIRGLITASVGSYGVTR